VGESGASPGNLLVPTVQDKLKLEHVPLDVRLNLDASRGGERGVYASLPPCRLAACVAAMYTHLQAELDNGLRVYLVEIGRTRAGDAGGSGQTVQGDPTLPPRAL
jgi:hypothetical protein